MPDTPADDEPEASPPDDPEWDRGLFEFLFSRKPAAEDRAGDDRRRRSYWVDPRSWFTDRTRPSGI
jgi:hypothetical protein